MGFLKKNVFHCWPIFLFLASTDLFSQETLSSVQRDLDRVERETTREKDLHKAERLRASEFEKRKGEKLEAIRSQIHLVEQQIDSLKRKSESERKRKSGQNSQTLMFQSKQKEFRALLTKEIGILLAWTEKDFPYQKEKRVSEWRELEKVSQEGSLSIEETLARLFALIQSSMDLSQDTEIYPGTYTAVDGSQNEGTYVRLGTVMLAFSSLDTKRLAYLVKKDMDYAWVDTNIPPTIREGILSAIQVAKGKVPPQLVPLPLMAPMAKEVAQ